MITYYDNDRTYEVKRLHPYSSSAISPSGFIDFKKNPERISTSLEDFLPHSEHTAVQTFYKLLEYLNGKDSFLETCDCVLRPPSAHSDNNSELPLSVHGRLFIMYRDQKLNCSVEHFEWLCGKLMSILSETDPELTAAEGVVGFTLNPALHTAISNGIWLPDGQFECDDDDPGNGAHTMLSFWAYGNDDIHTFKNLDRVFNNIKLGCMKLNDEINTGIERHKHET